MPSSMFQSLRCRFLLAYLMVMSGLFGLSATAVYTFFRHNINEQLNKELLNLAQAAGPSLKLVKNSGAAGLEPHWSDKLPWHDAIKREEGIEWFNAEGKLLAKHGTIFSDLPLAKYSFALDLEEYSSVQPQDDNRTPIIDPHKNVHREQGPPVIEQQRQIRTLTVAVYTDDPNKKTLQLEGYIRVSESTQEVDSILAQLQFGLGVGGILMLMVSSFSGVYLSRMTLKPIQQSFVRLKQFSADASHELRNPLTAIATTVDLMQSHPEQLDASSAKKLAIISSATDQISRLVEDLLFLIRSDATVANVELGGSLVCLDKVLKDLVERFKLQAQSREIHFEVHLVTDISVKGDVHQLSRLFTNLIENAFKYTEKGGKVTLFLEKHNRFAIVRVEDTGIGIAQEYLPFVFQRFWRSDKAQSQQKDGLGLGLAIAQNIAHRHRGEIKVTSQLGIGSSFQVYLPLACSVAA
jgi:two-component system, OmpR family, manganese sensing sensor histidine kinase